MNDDMYRAFRRRHGEIEQAIVRLPFVRAALRLPFLLRVPLVFLVPAVVFGGMAYYGGHSGPPYNGARTFGEAVAIGVVFGTMFSGAYVLRTAVLWLRDRIFGRESGS